MYVILMITLTLAAIAIGQLWILVKKSRKAQQLFKEKSPGLPVVPNPQLFTGHTWNLALTSRAWKKLDGFHAELGETFGFFHRDRPCVSTCDLELIKTMVIDEPDDHVNRISPGSPIDEFEYDNIAIAKDDQWRKLRKAITPAFSTHKIKSPNVQAEIKSVIEKFVSSLDWRLERARKESNENFFTEDAEDIFHRYALDMVFTCFYKQEKMIDFKADKDPFVETIMGTFRQLLCVPLKVFVSFPFLRPIFKLIVSNFHPLGRMRDKIVSFIERQTKLNFDARIELEKARKLEGLEAGKIDEDNIDLKGSNEKFRRNLIDYVIDQYHDGKLTRAEYINTSYFLFFAANKTSADSMAKLVYFLASHQEIQEKLRKSISEDGIESEYLGWCLNESLRLFPPALIGCSRTITRDIETKAGLVPAGTFVLTSTWTIHHSTKIWGPDALEFKPERWADAKNFHPVQFLAFGAGKRSCPGKDFAIQEVKMLLSVLMRKFKFERSPKTTDSMLFESPDYIFMVSDLPTWIKFSPIESS